MALQVSDFFQPKGQLRESAFPDDVVPELYVNTWLDAAETKAEDNLLPDEATDGVKAKEEATEAWVYYRAYNYLAEEMEDGPVSASIEGKGSVTYEASQLRKARRRADNYKTRYETLVRRYEENEPYKNVQYTL